MGKPPNGGDVGLIIPLWQMSNAACVSYTKHPLLNLSFDVVNGPIASWRVPKGHGYFWICQEMGVTPCLSEPLVIQHNDTCLLALIFSHGLYHMQEKFLAQRHKREPLMVLAITTLIGLGVVGTALGTSPLVILQEMGIIRSQLTVILEKTETALHYLLKSLDSLARVTVQNRRGLLLMEQGGIGRALGKNVASMRTPQNSYKNPK